MDKNTVLSLSPNEDILKSREETLRKEGLNVISVMSPVQARFEIEMGRCGVFLICYRLSSEEAQELSRLFRTNCREGRIVFVTEQDQKKEVPTETNYAVPESGGPEAIVQILKETGENSGSSEFAA
jgi:DNA-binding NtrC family response regulator